MAPARVRRGSRFHNTEQEDVMPVSFVSWRRGLLASLVWLVACGPGEAAQAQRAAATAETPTGGRTEVDGPAPTAIDTSAAARLSSAFRSAADQALPAVVSIQVSSTRRVVRGQPPIFRFFPDFPGLPNAPREFDAPMQGTGSGFIFDERGYIMTNRHVVNDADRVVVTLSDGREYNATVVGTDAMTDVAVLKIEPEETSRLPVALLGDSDRLQVGDWVLALGNPLGLDFTVTAGIVSAKGRSIGILNNESEAPLEAFIQTDAAINPGNSGGPLVDLRGRVVGVNTAIASRTGYYAGYGFAIPIAVARKVASDLVEFGAVRRPRLGVGVNDVTAVDAEVYGLEEIAGAEVAQVQAGTPAAKAGLQLGDVIVALDGEKIHNAADLITRLAQRQPGERVKLELIRNGKRQNVTVELGQFDTESSRDRSRKARPEAEELLGFRTEPLTPERARRLDVAPDEGVLIADVVPFSAAAQANIRPGIVLLRLNGKEVNKPADVDAIARSLEPGDVVSAVVRIPGQGETIINYRTRR